MLIIEKPNAAEQKVLNAETLQKMVKVLFANEDRLRIVRLIAENPKSFLEIKKKLNLSPLAAYADLKELIKEAIIFKTDEGKYCITLFGRYLLNDLNYDNKLATL